MPSRPRPSSCSRALRRDLGTNAGYLRDPEDGANQSAPLLLSDAGRVIWPEKPFAFSFENNVLNLEGDVTIATAGGGTLRAAFQHASEHFFPASGGAPARELFTGPQYNTWIEAPFLPTQAGVMAYAQGLLDAGFPPGVLMIDDNWAPDYGDWRFEHTRFPDARVMVEDLHALGFPSCSGSFRS